MNDLKIDKKWQQDYDIYRVIIPLKAIKTCVRKKCNSKVKNITKTTLLGSQQRFMKTRSVHNHIFTIKQTSNGENYQGRDSEFNSVRRKRV